MVADTRAGPIIDTAIPAARAIFSDDSKPPDSPPPVPASNAAPAKSDPAPPPLDIKSQILEPLDINLKKTEAQIGTVLESVNHLQSNLEEEFKQTAESLGGEILDAFNEKMKDVLDYHHHSEYINHLNAITAARLVIHFIGSYSSSKRVYHIMNDLACVCANSREMIDASQRLLHAAEDTPLGVDGLIWIREVRSARATRWQRCITAGT